MRASLEHANAKNNRINVRIQNIEVAILGEGRTVYIVAHTRGMKIINEERITSIKGREQSRRRGGGS